MFSQLFYGYPVPLHDTVNVDGDVVKAVAFKKVSNALRFAMALQTGLLCAEWPHQVGAGGNGVAARGRLTPAAARRHLLAGQGEASSTAGPPSPHLTKAA